jgi:hypothetical protein
MTRAKIITAIVVFLVLPVVALFINMEIVE